MGKAYIVCGSPGAGKSTYGRHLAGALKAAFIDIDTATERLVKLSLSQSGHDPDDRDSTYFKTTFREPVYEQLFDIAKENLHHMDVVIAGPFTREIRNPKWPSLLEKKLGSSVEVHYILCRPEIRKQRITARNNPRDKAKLDHWNAVNDYYGDEEIPPFSHVLVDNSAQQTTKNEKIDFQQS